jgi:hypothetical protein
MENYNEFINEMEEEVEAVEEVTEATDVEDLCEHDDCCEHDECDCCDTSDSEIEIKMSTGLAYYINANFIDWESLFNQLDEVKDNADLIRHMMLGALDGSKGTVDAVISTVGSFISNFGIADEVAAYHNNNDFALSDRELMICICTDAINLCNTMIYEATMRHAKHINDSIIYSYEHMLQIAMNRNKDNCDEDNSNNTDPNPSTN